MGKFSDFFDEESAKHTEMRRADEKSKADAQEAEEARRLGIFKTIQEIVIPVIEEAQSDLASRGVTVDTKPDFSQIHREKGEGTYSFRLQAKHHRRSPNSPHIYSFRVYTGGSVAAYQIDENNSYGNTDRRIFHAERGELTPEMVERAVNEAITELAKLLPR